MSTENAPKPAVPKKRAPRKTAKKKTVAKANNPIMPEDMEKAVHFPWNVPEDETASVQVVINMNFHMRQWLVEKKNTSGKSVSEIIRDGVELFYLKHS